MYMVQSKEDNWRDDNMEIRVTYVDCDREYAQRFAEYVEKNCSDRIALRERNITEYKTVKNSDCDVLLTGIAINSEEQGYMDVPVIVLDNNEFDNTVGDRTIQTSYKAMWVHMCRYQKLENIICRIEQLYQQAYENKNVGCIKQYVIENYDLAKLSNEQLKNIIANIIEEKKVSISILEEHKQALVEQVYSAIRGLGILDKILSNDEVTEIMINDYNHIFIEKAGCLRKYEGPFFESREQLGDIIQKIVGKNGREVNKGAPIVDTRLDDGSRVNVVLSPISLHGHTMTIRRFYKEPMNVGKLIGYGSISTDVARKLECLVRARYNILISGGTGSGKTTFLNAMSNFIPKDERIITIEDSAELQIVGIENLISLETRNANSSGAGEITIRDLIKTSLRMRPDRIVVGEVRGDEALDMLQAMNTGHDGSLSTAHANSSHDLISRLSTMVLQGAASLPLEAVKQQIASAVDIIIHLSRLRDHSRKVMEISEVVGYENGEVILNPLYVFEELPGSSINKVEGNLVRTTNPFYNTEKLIAAGINEEI